MARLNFICLFTLVLCVLSALSGCTTEHERTAMRQGLDSINLRNRNDLPFSPEDVQPFVAFFDDHGMPNDRMLAHYLLGRAHHENGEAPMALQCYHDAIDCADTTSSNCDFAQLSRVYSQMAEIFYHQNLFSQQAICDMYAERLAWKGKDTLAALMNSEQRGQAYLMQGKKDSALMIFENVHKNYLTHGYERHAAISLFNQLNTILHKGQIKKARNLIHEYETKSNLFDSLGDIEEGREIFYYIKGSYYMAVGKLDSALFYFHKELEKGKDFNNQNAGSIGLAKLFQIKNMPDSSSKYYQYAYAMNDSMYDRYTIDNIGRINAMYDYSSHERIALQERERAQHQKYIIILCISFIIIILTIFRAIVIELRHKKKEIEQKYGNSLLIIEHANKDLLKLKTNQEINTELISEKEQIIIEQETIIKSLLNTSHESKNFADNRLRMSDIYKSFDRMATIGKQPSEDEWRSIEILIRSIYPGISDLINGHEYHLTDKERKTCLMTKIGIKPKAISNMLGVDPSYISNIRSAMSEKLFSLTANPKTFDKMIKGVY